VGKNTLKNKFYEIDATFLSTVATDSDRIPTLYYSNNIAIKKFFWMRLKLINLLMSRYSNTYSNCLDFGGGGGVFLPTLSKNIGQVVCIDLENSEADKIIQEYVLENVTLVQGDVSDTILEDAPFKNIIAADVLEHFQDISIAVDAIIKWLDDDGVFYTSLPTENWIYVLLRKIFHIQKPWDHYHTAKEVEDYLVTRGFKKIKGIYVPFYIRIFPLFRISAWRFIK